MTKEMSDENSEIISGSGGAPDIRVNSTPAKKLEVPEIIGIDPDNLPKDIRFHTDASALTMGDSSAFLDNPQQAARQVEVIDFSKSGNTVLDAMAEASLRVAAAKQALENKLNVPQLEYYTGLQQNLAGAAAILATTITETGVDMFLDKVQHNVGVKVAELALMAYLAAGCTPPRNIDSTPTQAVATEVGSVSFPTEQAPFDVSYSGTNLKGEIVKSTGEIPSGISDRAKQAVEKQGLSWDKVTVFGLGLQDSSGNVESPIFAIRKNVDTKPGEAGMYFYTEAGDFAVPLLVPPGTGKEGSGFLVPMAYSFNADKTRMRWGLASEDRDGNLELGDANAILFTFELDANGKITKVTYSDPYSKKSFSWLTDNVPDNLKKIHDYAISHSTSGQKATETPTNEVTNTPEPTATATALSMDGESDPALVRELAANLKCTDNICMREIIGSPSKVEVELVSTGNIKSVRLEKENGAEYATSMMAEMVTRAQNGEARRVWIPIRTELDSDKGKNSDRIISSLIIQTKLGGDIDAAKTKELFPIEWFSKWFTRGSQFSIYFDRSGSPLLNIYKDSRLASPEVVQRIKNFFATGGNTLDSQEDTILTPSGFSQ